MRLRHLLETKGGFPIGAARLSASAWLTPLVLVGAGVGTVALFAWIYADAACRCG